MKLKLVSPHFIVLSLFCCTQRKEDISHVYNGPKMMEAKGYVVPRDSMAEPTVIPLDESKLRIVAAGNPTIVTTNNNVFPASKPKVVPAGIPRIYTPGQDSFALPKTVLAIDSSFVAGMPEVVMAKDAYTKEHNPQTFSSFGKLQGLKHGDILSILQDQNGNIWLGTVGGVNIYNGNAFTSLTVNEGLSENTVQSILEDYAGNLWFGTRRSGISKYDGKSLTHFTTIEGLNHDEVTCLLEDTSGNLWIGTRGGISVYNGSSFTHLTVKEGLCNNNVTSLIEDKAGNIWIGTLGGGVNKYDGKSFTHFTVAEGLADNFILSILEDHHRNIWFGAQDGSISKYDGKFFTYFNDRDVLTKEAVVDILEDQSGNIWFGTYGGVIKYDGEFFTRYTDKEGLSTNFVLCMLEDRSGNMWFGTRDGGVSRYNGKSFTHFTEKEGLNKNVVWCISDDHSGNLWFGCQAGGLNKYDGKSFTIFTTEEGLPDNNITTIQEDGSRNIWFGTNAGGVSHFDGKVFTHYNENVGFTTHVVNDILQDKYGVLWFASEDDGIFLYDRKTFTHFTEKEGLSTKYITSIMEDHIGNLWFGTDKGAIKYDRKAFTYFMESEGLTNSRVNNILEDQNGDLWFSIYGDGVAKYDGKSFTHFTEKEGLVNNYVFVSLQDQFGNLWFGTRFGLSKLTNVKLNELNAQVKSKSSEEGEIFFNNYSYEDGFLGIGCNVGSICEDRNGIIWFGTNDRLTAYHPEGDIRDTNPPNMQLNGLSIFNELIPWPVLQNHQDSTITLSNGVKIRNIEFDSTSKWYGVPQNLSLRYDNNDLSFSFIGITQKSPKKVKYLYTLEGNDENWSSLTPLNEAHYGNLSYGHYTFKVKAMNSQGYWSDELHYPFTIRPPWWLTWWAYSLYALGIIILLWRIHKIQQARTIRIEREKTQERELKQAKEIETAYHDLELAHTNLKSTQAQLIHSEKMASLGELTAGIAHEIQNPLNFVNNFSEVNAELIDELNAELAIGNLQQAKEIGGNIKENEEKIIFHGKRADAIVKGMLQHSRASSGIKEPTDINALTDEYLRLAYHGLRAKDKTFNATMKTDFDPAIGMVNIVPQDIGRVILNLITNAFYAVTEKIKSGSEGYVPTVTVSTMKTKSYIEITVKDNGNGISPNIVDKIFQPFFTTKPTGEGTGLGLSLSYDIIKAHGGDITVETKLDQGTTFIISLPQQT